MKKYSAIEGDQLMTMNDIQHLLEEKYPHIVNSVDIKKEENIISMRIVCNEEPIEIEEVEEVLPSVFDVDPDRLDDNIMGLTEEGISFLSENLFKNGMPLSLGWHLLHCAICEEKAANSDKEHRKPNGRSVSLMLRAMDEMGYLVFHSRSDMTEILHLVFGSWIEDDKHFLDYFYSCKDDNKRALIKLTEYKQAIQLWMNSI